MTVQEFKEYDNHFSLRIVVNGCEESTRLVRMLIEGKLNGVSLDGFYPKDANAVLRIEVQKSRPNRYRSVINIGARDIF